MGTACYVKRAAEIYAALHTELGLEPDQQTTPDGKVSLTTARCLGSCGLAPVMVLDGDVLGKETPESMIERMQALLQQNQQHQEEPA